MASRVRGFLDHRLAMTREFKKNLEDDGGVSWTGGDRRRQTTASTDEIRGRSVRYALPLGGKSPAVYGGNREEEVAAFKGRTIASLTKRSDVDEKLLARLDRVDAALAEAGGKPATSVIEEGAALLRLEAKLSREFADANAEANPAPDADGSK